jgi:hypothetical protein
MIVQPLEWAYAQAKARESPQKRLIWDVDAY